MLGRLTQVMTTYFSEQQKIKIIWHFLFGNAGFSDKKFKTEGEKLLLLSVTWIISCSNKKVSKSIEKIFKLCLSRSSNTVLYTKESEKKVSEIGIIFCV